MKRFPKLSILKFEGGSHIRIIKKYMEGWGRFVVKRDQLTYNKIYNHSGITHIMERQSIMSQELNNENNLRRLFSN